MWVDATVAAGLLFDPQQSQVADKLGFAQAPVDKHPKGSNWLWSWALGIPASSDAIDDAKTFINWATSKDYVKLVGEGERLGGRAAGHPHLDLRQPGVHQGRTLRRSSC